MMLHVYNHRHKSGLPHLHPWDHCQGYQKERVTPYMHIMAYHIPRLMMLHKGIKKFSGQGKLLKTKAGNKF